MLQPTRTKYRKAFKGRIKGKPAELLPKLWSIWSESYAARQSNR